MPADLQNILQTIAADVESVSVVPRTMVRRARRRKVLTASLGLTMATVLVVVAVVGARAIGIDQKPPVTSRPVITAQIELDGEAGSIASVGESIWVSRCNRLSRIDAGTNRVTATIRVGGCPELAGGFGSLWVSTLRADEPGVSRLDPVSGRQLARVSVAMDHPAPIAIGEGFVWVASGRSLTRIDPATNTSRVLGPFPKTLGSIAVGLGSVWAVVERSIIRINVGKGDVQSTIARDDADGDIDGSLFVFDGAVWIAGDSDRFHVEKVDPNKRRKVAKIAIPGRDPTWEPTTALVQAGNAMWVTRGTDIARIDRRLGQVTTVVPLGKGNRAWGLAATARSLWVLCFDGPVLRLDNLASPHQ